MASPRFISVCREALDKSNLALLQGKSSCRNALGGMCSIKQQYREAGASLASIVGLGITKRLAKTSHATKLILKKRDRHREKKVSDGVYWTGQIHR